MTTSLADRTIDALRRNHDDLVPLVTKLTSEQLATLSGASEWPVAQVLSHLGSGAEISAAGIRAALDGQDAPGQEFNESVWERWNAMSPEDQAGGFVESDGALVALLESLAPEQRERLELKLGFLPAPLPIASIAGMRLNEATLHAWDVAVAFDPSATVEASTAAVLAEHFTGGLGFLLGFTGKADQLPEPATVAIGTTDVRLVIADQVSLSTEGGDSTASFEGELESAIRLLAGRLGPAYTPAGLQVEGNVTLDQLREVFPGY